MWQISSFRDAPMPWLPSSSEKPTDLQTAVNFNRDWELMMLKLRNVWCKVGYNRIQENIVLSRVEPINRFLNPLGKWQRRRVLAIARTIESWSFGECSCSVWLGLPPPLSRSVIPNFLLYWLWLWALITICLETIWLLEGFIFWFHFHFVHGWCYFWFRVLRLSRSLKIDITCCRTSIEFWWSLFVSILQILQLRRNIDLFYAEVDCS